MTWSEADLELLCSQVDDSIRSQKEENVELVNKLVILTETIREVENYNHVLKRRLHDHSDQPKSKKVQKLLNDAPTGSKFIKQEEKQKNNHLLTSKIQHSSDNLPRSVQSTPPIRVTMSSGPHTQEKVLNSTTSSLLRPPIISTSNPSTNRIQIQHLKPGQQIRLSHPNSSSPLAPGPTSTIRIANTQHIMSSKSATVTSSVPIILSPRCSSTSMNASSPGLNIRTALTPRVSSGSVITVAARASGQSTNPTVLHIQKSVNVQSISSTLQLTATTPNAHTSSSLSSIPGSAVVSACVRKSTDSTITANNKEAAVAVNQVVVAKPTISNAFKNFAKSIGSKIAAEYGGAIDQAKMAAELMQRWKKLTEDERRKYI